MICLWTAIEAHKMEGGEGMVAVVRGLRDAGLAVTLLDGNRHYTLMPNNVTNTATSTNTAPPVSAPFCNVSQRSQQTQHQQDYNVNVSTDSANRCECSAQATDGRYASTYKTTHCNLNPTSPPQFLSEFPPQRSHVNRGHGNFQVGGTGSGDTSHRLAISNNSFRGAMCWPDRGSVCISRASQEVDAFANSLRKYPNMSPDRSTELVERLISYTQNKNAAKFLQARSQQSPTQISESSSQNIDRSLRSSAKSQRNYEPDVRVRPRTEEAPTRDIRCKPSESPTRPIYAKSFDIRYTSDNMSKRVREIKCNSCYPYQLASPNFRERCDKSPPEQRLPLQQNSNSVSVEIQAGVKMVSREAATVPQVESPIRTVAVTQSASKSAANRTPEGAVSQTHDKQTQLESTDFVKTVPTLYPVNQSFNLRKSIQTTLSFTDLDNRWRCNENVRKSKSHEDLRVHVNEDITCLLRNIVLNVHNHINSNRVAPCEVGTMLKDYIFDTNMGEKRRFQIGKYDNEKPEYCHIRHFKHMNDVNNRTRKRMRIDNSICVYRAEITPFHILTIDDELENIINDWFSIIDIKSRDHSGRPVDRKYIFNIVTNRLKFLINGRSKYDVMSNLKTEIMDIVKDIPIEIRERGKKWVYINNVVDILYNNIKSMINDDLSQKRREFKFSNNFLNHDVERSSPLYKFRKHIQPTEEELREFIYIEMMELMEKFHSTIDFDSWDDIEVELTDILLDSMEAICRNDDREVKNEIITVLIEIGGLTEHQSIHFANNLIEHLRELFSVPIDKGQIKNNFLSQTFVVMPGLNYSRQNQSYNSNSDFSIGGISDSDTEANFNAYTNQIVQQIDDWLNNLQLPDVDDKVRQVVVKDLAGDIVDRQKYLELNPGSRGSNDDELSYLKYQIFKYINKSHYINNTLAIKNASDLMQRIQNVPVPFLKRHNDGNASQQMFNSRSARRMNTSQMPMFGSAGPGGSMIQPARDITTYRRLSSPGAIPYRPMQVINEYPTGQNIGISAAQRSQTNVAVPTFKQTNDEYEEFLNNWVQEIPIPATTPQEKEFANKMRQGIFNGVWKSLAKVRSNPDKYYDTFHIQDVLDDDIEELLDLLPQSQELVSKKFNLKNDFITKTTGTTKKQKLLLHPSWYKEELIDKFLMVWLRRTVTKTDDEDPVKLFEELQALKLVEDFILYVRYKDDDKVKSNVYKNKLMKNVKDLVVKVKATHEKELRDIDPEQYVHDIFTALHLVPVPNDETILEEADEILLGLEVDQWYTDLPLVESDDPEEHLKRRRLRDALVKKIHTLEKEGSLSNSNVEDELKQETSRFLNKMPIPQDESLNINFMVEELANRVKNRPKSPSPKQVKSKGRRKSVVFDESVAYDDFSRVMPCCSSFSELPGTRQAQVNETQHTIYMRDATRSSIDYSADIGGKKPPAPVQPYYVNPQNQFDPSFQESQEQWLTLHESGEPVKATAALAAPVNWKDLPSRTYHDSASQLQDNQSGQYASHMPAQISQGVERIRQEQALMRQATCNQFPMEVQNIPQQSVRLDQVGQQSTCRSKIPCQGPFQQISNQLPKYVQSLPQPFSQRAIPRHLNQSEPLNLLVDRSTCKSQLPFQGLQQNPNQLSMPVQSIPQQVNQSIRLDQPVQQVSCGTQSSCQGPVQTLQEMPNQSIARQIPQSCGPTNRAPRTQASGAGILTSRGILGTSQIPGPSGIPCNQIGRVHQCAPCAPAVNLQISPNQNVPVSTNQNLPCNMPVTTQPVSAFGLPVGHSTPQNAILREILPRVLRKRTREPKRQRERARRQIDLEQPDEGDDDETDSDRDDLCRCLERFRCRRRPRCPYDSYNFPRFPMPFPYHYYY